MPGSISVNAPPGPLPGDGAASDGGDGASADAGGAGVCTSALSLSLTTMGAGVLSLPYAAAQTGLVPLLCVIAALCGLSAFCNLVNAEAAWRASRARALRSRTFDELCGRTLSGRWAYAGASAQVLCGLAGTLVGFLCVAGDLGTPALGARLGGRAGVIAAFAGGVVLPLAGCARIHSLRAASALGVAAVVAVVGLLVARGGAAAAADSAAAPALFVPTLRGLWLAIPCVLYAVGNQVVGVNVFFDASASVQRAWHKPVALAYALIGGLYVAGALGGAAAFGALAKGDVLLNFDPDDGVANALKCVMALHVALVLPVDIVPLRRSLALAMRRCARRVRARGGAAAAAGIDAQALLADALLADGEAAEPPAAAPAPADTDADAAADAADAADDAAADAHEAALPRVCGMPCSPAIAGQTVGLVACAASAAVFLPQLSVVFGLLGATLGVTCMSGYPALFLLAKARATEAAGGRLPDEDGAPIYSPASPLLLRVLGWAILVLSIVMAVLGTGVCIYSTWVAPAA